ncbi:MAG: DUF6578 domain-containing protein [Gulosibacter sp.]|uniref:DUF6578 domain-containing protein n=1 Tax=Gulosibacter sp. TaxID=2817531 RepID=UPI003F9110DA
MIIDVKLDGWQFHCCGVLPTLGEEVHWCVFACDPELVPSGEPAQFYEDHHEMEDVGFPTSRISGRVLEIYRESVLRGGDEALGVVGNALSAGGREQLQSLSLDDFVAGRRVLVRLEIPDGSELPPYQAEPDEPVWRIRSRDELGEMLNELTGRLAEEYLEIAAVVRNPEQSSIQMTPRASGAAEFRMSRSSGDEDGIEVSAGDGFFRLVPEPQSLLEIEAMLVAVAAGNISSRVLLEDSRAPIFRIEITGHSHQTWLCEFQLKLDELGHDADRYLRPRIEAGDIVYAPWSG